MKFSCLSLIGILLLSGQVYSQKFQISINAHTAFLLGDFTSKDLGVEGAAYVDFGSGGSLEAKYYVEEKWGLGIRGGYCVYARDYEAYSSDLRASLGIVDENYLMPKRPFLGSSFFQVGLSRKFNLDEKLLLEPYGYIGFKTLFEPNEEVVFLRNGITYNYSNNETLFGGFNYSIGTRLFIILGKYTGLYIFLEYDGTILSDNTENVAVLYSYDSFQKTELNPNYDLNAVNLGLGFAVSFGKGKGQE